MNVHVNDNSLATILSLKDVSNNPGVHVTMDTLKDKAMNEIMTDGTFLSSRDVYWGYTIMIRRVIMIRIVIKIMQQLPHTPLYQL